MSTKLIGIHGPALSGKDTLAAVLCERHGFKMMAFAAPLKIAVAHMFGWPLELCFSQDGKAMRSEFWGLQVRDALQQVGEGVRKMFGEDFWVRRWLYDYVQVQNQLSVVLTDVRYENEADSIRGYGGTIVHLKRDGAGLTGAQSEHSSERGIQFHDSDILIENNGTLAELALRADALVKFLDARPNRHSNWQ